MVNSCCVCGVEQSILVDVAFHKLPKHPLIRKKWFDVLKKDETRKVILVCGNHFHPSDYRESTLKPLLKRDAVPRTEFLHINPSKLPVQDHEIILENCETEVDDPEETVNIIHEDESETANGEMFILSDVLHESQAASANCTLASTTDHVESTAMDIKTERILKIRKTGTHVPEKTVNIIHAHTEMLHSLESVSDAAFAGCSVASIPDHIESMPIDIKNESISIESSNDSAGPNEESISEDNNFEESVNNISCEFTIPSSLKRDPEDDGEFSAPSKRRRHIKGFGVFRREDFKEETVWIRFQSLYDEMQKTITSLTRKNERLLEKVKIYKDVFDNLKKEKLLTNATVALSEEHDYAATS